MSPATLSRKAQTALQAKSDLAAGPRGSTPSRPCHSTLRAGDHSAVSKQRLLCRANVISAADQHRKQRESSRSELSADTWNPYKNCMLGSLRGENKWRIPLFLSRCFLKHSGSGCPPALGQTVCPAAHGWCLELRRPWGGHMAVQGYQPCQGSLKKHHNSLPLSLPQVQNSAARHWLIPGQDFF